MAEYITHSERRDRCAGPELAAVLPDGALIAFTGGLGAGKTAFTEGLAEVWAAPTRCPAQPLPS